MAKSAKPARKGAKKAKKAKPTRVSYRRPEDMQLDLWQLGNCFTYEHRFQAWGKIGRKVGIYFTSLTGRKITSVGLI